MYKVPFYLFDFRNGVKNLNVPKRDNTWENTGTFFDPFDS